MVSLEDIAAQMAAMNAQMQTILQENQTLRATQQAQEASAAEREQLLQAQLATLASAGSGSAQGDARDPTLVGKWAPENFSGAEEDWRVFALKFRSYVGAMCKGQLGAWMDHVSENREGSGIRATLDVAASVPAATLYSALIATCEGKSIALVEKAGPGEGLEAWRLLLRRYEAQTRQSRVLMMIQLLSWDFTAGDLIDNLELFDRAVKRYADATKKPIDDDTKIGIVIKGLATGSLKEHLLLHSERCETYDQFRNEVDTLAKARNSNLLTHAPMDLSALKGKGKGKGKFQGTCHDCGQYGHRASECPAKVKTGQGAGPAATKRACFKCGMTNHLANECRASEEKKAKFKAMQAKKGLSEFSAEVPDQDGQEYPETDLGFVSLCQLCDVGQLDSVQDERLDRSERSITFKVDSGACTTVVPVKHTAVRGYRTWKDKHSGRQYGTAAGVKVPDRGMRMLQTKDLGGPAGSAMRLKTRSVPVSVPLMSVIEMVDAGNRVVFDGDRSYALHKATGRETEFKRTQGGWDLTLDLEAPEVANEVAALQLASVNAEKEAPSASNSVGHEVQADSCERAMGPFRGRVFP